MKILFSFDGGYAVAVLARRHQHATHPIDDTVRIGLAIPLQGPAGIFGPSCQFAAELCVRMLNENGILGFRVEIETIDAGARPAQIAAEVSGLIDRGEIHALTGWHISSVRSHLVPVTAGRIPYVYTSLYEGGEHRAGVFCSGETPLLQIAPSLSWLRDNLGVRRWFIIGDDYIWPRRSADAAIDYAHELGLQVVGSQFVRFGTQDFSSVVRDIRRSGADGVLMLLVGQDAVAFNRAFAAKGMHEQAVRFSPLMEENMLIASGEEAIPNLYVSAGYFRSLSTAGSLDLVGDYAGMFGADAPPLNNQAESCYEGIMVLANLIRAAQCLDVGCLSASADGVGYDGPRGAVELRSGHLQQKVHLAQANVADFDVLTTL